MMLDVLAGRRPLEEPKVGAIASGESRLHDREKASGMIPGPAPADGGPVVRVMGRGEEAEPPPAPRSRDRRERPPAREPTIFFDLETQKSAEEVGGWGNVSAMKLALAVTYNDVSAQFKVYREEDVDRLLLDLVMADRVIGYNIDRFDIVVLSAYSDWDLSRIHTFDMLADIYRKLGFRLKLADLAESTLKAGKSADGLQSLKWWKEGRVDLVEEYCRRDVEVTRDLYQFGATNGYVLYPNRDGRAIRLPVEWT
jgi:DEAD/DEAH box helicase domain-containing protein